MIPGKKYPGGGTFPLVEKTGGNFPQGGWIFSTVTLVPRIEDTTIITVTSTGMFSTRRVPTTKTLLNRSMQRPIDIGGEDFTVLNKCVSEF